jgi:chemotaxis methyl-accepting protein methylase
MILLENFMDDQQFRQLLDFFGLSWKGYQKVRKGVKKRVGRYMQEHGFHSMEEFLWTLEGNREQRGQGEKLMTVSISRFFRDRGLWQAVEKYLLPEIVAREIQKIKVWSAGCACGEEVYSFKILWDRLRDRYKRLPELELWATDLNPELLYRAQTGIFSLSSLKEVPEEWRTRYFSQGKEKYFAVSDFLKEKIFWKVHNLLANDPPLTGFQILFLRNNLLTYYQEEIQSSTLSRAIGGLEWGGFLIIGSHEKLPGLFFGLKPFPHHPNIFQKYEDQKF